MLKTENDGQKCFLFFRRLITCYTASMWRHFVPKNPLLHTAGYGPVNELSVYRKCAGFVGKWGKPPSLRS